jgi:DNA modification methylase
MENQDEKEVQQRESTFNGLTAKEWASLSKNVWNDVSSARKRKHLVHGATFPEKLASRLIRIYSKEGDWVLDPFLGTGTTLEACKNTGRNGVGIELNEQFVGFAKEICDRTASVSGIVLRAIHADCRRVLDIAGEQRFQLVVTSPPYADFIQKAEADRKTTHKNSVLTVENNSKAKRYSIAPEDFGNLGYPEFLSNIEALMKDLFAVTTPGGYNIWIVKDARDTKKGIPYVSFHADFARLGEEAGFKFHDLIVWDQNDQRRLVLLGYPRVFYTNQNCSFIVVLRKPI